MGVVDPAPPVGEGSDEIASDLPTDDEIFSALSNRRRRYVLAYLVERGEPAGLKELSRQVAARENDIPVADVTHKQRKRVYIALHQNHLPQLEDMGFIHARRASEAISLNDRAAALGPYLDPGERTEGELWLGTEIGLTLGGSLLVLLSWLDLYPLALLPDLFYTVALVVALAVVTVVRCCRTFGPGLELGS